MGWIVGAVHTLYIDFGDFSGLPSSLYLYNAIGIVLWYGNGERKGPLNCNF